MSLTGTTTATDAVRFRHEIPYNVLKWLDLLRDRHIAYIIQKFGNNISYRYLCTVASEGTPLYDFQSRPDLRRKYGNDNFNS